VSGRAARVRWRLGRPVQYAELAASARSVLSTEADRRSKSLVVVDGQPNVSGRGRLVVVVSPKGGAGTTTIATNLAVALRQMSAGRVVLVGMGGDGLRLSLPHLQDREITVTGAFRYANTWPTAIQLAASGRVDLDAVVTGHYDLASAEAALTAARTDPTAVKVIVRPGR